MKSYCDKCKRIDEVIGTLWNLKITGMNMIYSKERDSQIGKIERGRRRNIALKLMNPGGIALCEDCWFQFLDFNIPSEVSTEEDQVLNEAVLKGEEV